MTSNEPCVEQKTVTSNEITITDALLPVTLLRFTGRGTPAGNLLEWTTGMEVNSKEFVVERSANGTHFEGIARLNAAGSSQVQTHYSMLDAKSGIGKYYYRLKMSDLDGRFKYSGMVLIENGPGIVNTTLAPNPTKSGQSSLLTILGIQPDSRAIVSVINAGGATLKSYQLRQVNGTAQVALSADNLPAGLYIILIRDESGKVNETIRWNVIR